MPDIHIVKRKYLIGLLFIFLISNAYAEGRKYNYETGKGDIVNDRADEISVADDIGYFGYIASPPTVESALLELGASRAVVVSDVAYGISWDGVTLYAPSKNAVYDKIETLGTVHNPVTLDTNADTLLSLSTQELGLDTQIANKMFAGPESGANAIPTFRALIDGDIPDSISIIEKDTFYSVVSRGSVAGAPIYASDVIVTAGTASAVVVDAQYLEYSSGGAVTVRDDLSVNGDIYSVDQYTVTGNIGATGNLGAGTITPVYRLDIRGSGDAILNMTGNVGIGLVNPSQKLDVSGNAIISGGLVLTGQQIEIRPSLYYVMNNGNIAGQDINASGIIVTTGGGNASAVIVDTQNLENSAGGAVEVRDDFQINGNLKYKRSKCSVVENLAAADDNMSLGMFNKAVTITGVSCSYIGTGTTPATITLEDGSANAMTITGTNPTCVAHGTNAIFAPVTANNALVVGEILRFDVTNAVAPETDDYTICYEYTE